MLEIRALSARRGKRPVLTDVSLSLFPGELVGVLGLNGAGKTTLLHAVLGFCPIASGSVEADGEPVRAMSVSERARKLGYVPQSCQEGLRFPVEEFVSMGATAYLGVFSRPGREGLHRARNILDQLDCANLMGRRMDALSGGERRMAYLARAMLQNAPYLLLDEPVDSLDFSRQRGFLLKLREYMAKRNAGCLMTVHDPALAYRCCHRIILLHGGGVLADIPLFEDGSREALAGGLRRLYGEEARVDFLGEELVMGWAKNLFSKAKKRY